MTDNTTLLPCPFCPDGGTPLLNRDEDSEAGIVMCIDCLLATDNHCDWRESVKRWNTRARPSAPDLEVLKRKIIKNARELFEKGDAEYGSMRNWPLVESWIGYTVDDLSPLITRAPNEEALAALDEVEGCVSDIINAAHKNGVTALAKWKFKDQFQTIRAALGGNNER